MRIAIMLALACLASTCIGQDPDPKLVAKFRELQNARITTIDGLILELRESATSAIHELSTMKRSQTDSLKKAKINRRAAEPVLDGLNPGFMVPPTIFRTYAEKTRAIRASEATEKRIHECETKGIEGLSEKDVTFLKDLWVNTFPNSKDDALLFGLGETLKSLAEERRSIMRDEFNPSIDEVAIGMFGAIGHAKVLQVINDSEMLIQIGRIPRVDDPRFEGGKRLDGIKWTTLWIDTATTGIADNSEIKLSDCYYCYGTKTYTTASHASRTVFALRKLDLEPIRKTAMATPTTAKPGAPTIEIPEFP
jgi:hypothetical protein